MTFTRRLNRFFGDSDFYWEDAVRVAAEDSTDLRREAAISLPDLRREHPELIEGGMAHAQHMAARERALIRLLGPTDPPNRILVPDDPQLMVNWPGGGIHRWRRQDGVVFMTHGMSQPQEPDAVVDEPEKFWSGLGLEYAIRVPDTAEWPITVLLHLVRHELFQNQKAPFSVGATMPTDLGEGITHFFGTYDSQLPHELLLPGGRCSLVSLVGITSEEFRSLRTIEDRRLGAGVLIRTLRHFGVDAVTTKGRGSVTEASDFETVWQNALDSAQS